MSRYALYLVPVFAILMINPLLSQEGAEVSDEDAAVAAEAEASAEETPAEETAPAEDVPLVLFVKEAEGTVTYQTPDSTRWRRARVDTELHQDYRVQTGLDSRAILKSDEIGIEIFVSATSQITITRCLIPKDDPDAPSTHVDIRFGGITVNVTRDVRRTDMRVATPNITASVTGSAGSFESRAGFPDTVDFSSGMCTVMSVSTGETQSVGAGEATTSDLTSALATARNERMGNLQPIGTTEFEVEVATLIPESGALLPGEVNSEIGNPAFQRILNQSSSNIDAARFGTLETFNEFNTNVPPPLRVADDSRNHR
ncbi:MAG: hypothetical protein NUW37_14975 [Planctomycetes bacterium]|nr:hypothetical protein [Planctomycetota bacterium]